MKGTWTRRLLRGGAGLAALGVLGFLVAASGVVPITASAGHWAITEWFLKFSMRRSVTTHALGIATPPLDDPALVLKGAGHYELGCRPCHGSPADERPRLAREMTPVPPFVPLHVPDWRPRELFYITKHGIKMTAMPAWPALERDDEVWAVVAFLLTLPGMDAAEYRRLARNERAVDPADELASDLELGSERDLPATLPRAVADTCGRCHGVAGAGRGVGAFPRLAGQREEYLVRALRAYATGERASGIMGPIAHGLGGKTMQEVARYYAALGGQDRLGGAARGEESSLQAAATEGSRGYGASGGDPGFGRQIAHDGIPARKVPACLDCHGPGEHERNPAYPLLAGQYPDYLALQLGLFKKGTRGGSEYRHLMDEVVHGLGDEEIRAVASWYGGR